MASKFPHGQILQGIIEELEIIEKIRHLPSFNIISQVTKLKNKIILSSSSCQEKTSLPSKKQSKPVLEVKKEIESKQEKVSPIPANTSYYRPNVSILKSEEPKETIQ